MAKHLMHEYENLPDSVQLCVFGIHELFLHGSAWGQQREGTHTRNIAEQITPTAASAVVGGGVCKVCCVSVLPLYSKQHLLTDVTRRDTLINIVTKSDRACAQCVPHVYVHPPCSVHVAPGLQVWRHSEFNCSLRDFRSTIANAIVGYGCSGGDVDVVVLLMRTIADSSAAAAAIAIITTIVIVVITTLIIIAAAVIIPAGDVATDICGGE